VPFCMARRVPSCMVLATDGGNSQVMVTPDVPLRA